MENILSIQYKGSFYKLFTQLHYAQNLLSMKYSHAHILIHLWLID